MGRTSFSSVSGISALAALLMTAQPVQATKEQKPVRLTASSYWNIDYADENCRLARTFGKGENRHVLFFEQGGPDDRFAFTVAGPAFKKFRGNSSVEIGFGAFPTSSKIDPLMGTVEGYGDAVIYADLDFRNDGKNDDENDDENDDYQKEPKTSVSAIDVGEAAQVDFVSVRQRNREVIFETGKLSDAIVALNKCALDLVRVWGLDIEKHRNLSRMPVWTNRDRIVRKIQANYPVAARIRGEQAIKRMRVIVETSGDVSECKLEDATTSDKIGGVACKAMMRAKFQPALDADGKPMRSYYFASITYKID